MTTPAAWVEAWRGIPSMLRAVSMSRLTWGSPSYMSRRGLETFSASSRVMWRAPGPLGTCLAIWSTWA